MDSPAPAASPKELGWLLEGRYLVEALVSHGGMGSVFTGTDLKFQRRIAIKFLAERYEHDPEILDRFLREAHVAAHLDHPYIVPVYSVGDHEGRHYFVMKYLLGRTVMQLIRAKGRLPLPHVVHLAGQVCDALAHVHVCGFVHRDIKPNNIMVDPQGQCTVLDFGIFRSVDRPHTQSGIIAGTPEYMAPEQARDARAADGRSDLYALGVSLFEMLTGSLPFTGDSAVELLLKHQTDPPPHVSALVPGIPQAFDAFLRRALAKAPEERYQSAAEFKAAMRAAASPDLGRSASATRTRRGPAPARPGVHAAPRPDRAEAPREWRPPALGVEGAGRRPVRPRRRRWGVLLAMGLFLFWGIFVVAWFMLRYGDSPVPRGAAGPVDAGTAPALPAPAPDEPALARVAGLTVLSRPSGGIVRTGAVRLGRTPLRRVALAPGVYAVVVEKDGYLPWNERVTLTEGDHRTLEAVLEPAPALLYVSTTYRGRETWATISIGSAVVGSSPIAGHRIPPGSHRVVARRSGFEDAEKLITVRPGEVRKISLDLRAAAEP